MSLSLCVYKLVDLDKNKLLENKSSRTQLNFADLNIVDGLESAESRLKFSNFDHDNEQVHYEAVHYTENILHPIRFYLDDIEDSFSGMDRAEIKTVGKGTKIIKKYQEIYRFPVIINLKKEEIYVFTKKNVAKQFMKRFKLSGHFDFKYQYLDLSKIDDVTELSNVWGVWEDSQGKCKKKAYFGTEVNTIEDIKTKMVTSYNVEWDDGESTDLFIARECRLSSKSNSLTNSDLLNIYIKLRSYLNEDLTED